jgi:hypothetical protein
VQRTGLPENPTSLQIFKEHILTDIGLPPNRSATFTDFYGFLPVTAFSSAFRPLLS